ncbi:hypothetical protein ACQJBY_062136 [Aegilops geniculata]
MACTPTADGPTIEISSDGSSEPTMDVPMVHRSCPPRGGAISTDFKVTCDFGGTVENAKVNVGKLYLRQIFAGCNANQSDVIQPNAATGLGKTVVNNWGIYDGPCSEAKLVAKTHGMHTLAGKWSNWFTLVFVVGRFKGSTLQVMGANDDDEENEWAIVGGTGEFAMARGVINKRSHSFIGNTITQELTIEFFCRMKEIKFGPSEFVKQITGAGTLGSWLTQLKIITYEHQYVWSFRNYPQPTIQLYGARECDRGGLLCRNSKCFRHKDWCLHHS